jgi:uncharacterized protein (DUF1778 family)
MSEKPKPAPKSRRKTTIHVTETREASASANVVNKVAKRQVKNKTVNLRINARCLEVIDRAAALQSSLDRTKYILDAAYKAAENDLYNRVNFFLPDEAFSQIEEILNAKSRDLPKLRALLSEKAPWKK